MQTAMRYSLTFNSQLAIASDCARLLGNFDTNPSGCTRHTIIRLHVRRLSNVTSCSWQFFLHINLFSMYRQNDSDDATLCTARSALSHSPSDSFTDNILAPHHGWQFCNAARESWMIVQVIKLETIVAASLGNRKVSRNLYGAFNFRFNSLRIYFCKFDKSTTVNGISITSFIILIVPRGTC